MTHVKMKANKKTNARSIPSHQQAELQNQMIFAELNIRSGLAQVLSRLESIKTIEDIEEGVPRLFNSLYLQATENVLGKQED